jgi:hypothetical protein
MLFIHVMFHNITNIHIAFVLLCFAAFDLYNNLVAVVLSIFLIQSILGQGQWKQLPLAFQAYGILW